MEYKVAFAETVFANLIVKHNIPFLVADHFSDAVKVMFPDSAIAQKFHCKRTKTTHIVNEALAPHWDKKVEEMCRKEKISIMLDESNDSGDEKMLAILVRVHDEDIYRISTRFLAMPVCNIGTAENIYNALNEVFIDRNVPWKNCIGYASDNANVMVGRNNSVLLRVRERTKTSWTLVKYAI